MSYFSEMMNSLWGNTGTNPSVIQAQNLQNDIDARERKRQADITAGKNEIDSGFGQFNDDYYNKFKNDYVGGYKPEISNQYGRALGQLTATLAGRDTLEGTPGADALGQLQKARTDAETNIGNAATDASNALRANVENTKNNLYALNTTAADPLMMQSRVGSAATSLAAPQSQPALGDVFAGALAPFNAASKTDASSLNPQFPWNQSSQSAPLASGRGSGIFG